MLVCRGSWIASALFVCACAGPESAALEESTTGERAQDPADRRRDALAPLLAERRKARDADEARRVSPGVDKGELAKSFEASVRAMQRYFGAALEQAGLLAKDSRERNEHVDALLGDLKSEREYHDELDYGGVVLWLEFAIGRAYVLAGDVDRACKEGFDPVVEWYNAGPRRIEWLDTLRLSAFKRKATALFDARRYEKVVETADDMLTPPHGFAWALDDPKGNAVILLKARALYLKKPPDFEGAIRECQRVIDRGLMPWADRARILLAVIHRLMPTPMPQGDKPCLSPQAIHRKAVGYYHRAQEQRSPARRRRFLERAVKGLRDTITACRQEDVPYVTRLEHESSAWFELGICYSSMKLWYEAGFAFEAVLRLFSEEKVGRELAKD
ncbi:MAG: hypothetical protein ACYTFI_16485, partial [Planctomycetota bacterium]